MKRGILHCAAAVLMATAAGVVLAAGAGDHRHDDGAHHPQAGGQPHHDAPAGGHGDHHQDHHGGSAAHHNHQHWAAPAEAAARRNPVAASTDSVQRGKKAYVSYCVSCHGDSGRGDGPAGHALTPPPANLAVMAPQHTDGDLAWKIEHGRGAMPGWGGVLSDEEIWDVVNYVKVIGKGG